MNETQLNTTAFVIHCGYACKPLPYILSCIVFILFIACVFVVCKLINKSILSLFRHQYIYYLEKELIVVEERKCCYCIVLITDIFGLRHYARNEKKIIKKKREVYKCLWLNSFFWLIVSFVYCVMIFIVYYEIDITYALSFLGGLAIFIAVCSQTIFVPYFSGFMYILTDQIRFFESYDLYALDGTKVFSDVKFLGFTTREALFKSNKKEREEPFQIPAEHLSRYVLKKIKSL